MANENEKALKTRLKQKIDTAENWKKAGDNGFVPLDGEVIFYRGNPVKMKVGNGTDNVNALPFIAEQEIVQEMGTSETAVMSQKASTDSFLPKVTTANSSFARLYGVNHSGGQYMENIGQNSPTGSTIVKRTSSGTIRTATPTTDNDATTKKYVDDAVAVVDEKLNGYATEGYVDAEVQDATSNKLTVEMSGGRTPVSTYSFALTIDDEYFYEENDNIVIYFEGDVNPDFKLTLSGRTTKTVLFNGIRCSDLDVYWDYSTYTNWRSAYYVYFGEEMGVQIGDTIEITIDIYDDSVLDDEIWVNVAPAGMDQIKLEITPMEDDTTSEPPVLIISGTTAKLSIDGVLYPLNIQVVQETGTSETAVMSQKAVTDAVNNAVEPKLDRRGNANKTYPELYQISTNGTQGVRILQSIWQDDESVLIAYSAAQRDDKGCIQVGTPTKNVDATNKKYVDEALAALREELMMAIQTGVQQAAEEIIANGEW